MYRWVGVFAERETTTSGFMGLIVFRVKKKKGRMRTNGIEEEVKRHFWQAGQKGLAERKRKGQSIQCSGGCPPSLLFCIQARLNSSGINAHLSTRQLTKYERRRVDNLWQTSGGGGGGDRNRRIDTKRENGEGDESERKALEHI